MFVPYACRVILDTEYVCSVDSSVTFYSPEVAVGDEAVYQLVLAPIKGVDISEMPFESLEIHFSKADRFPPIVLQHDSELEDSSEEQKVRLVDVASGSTSLQWEEDQSLVLTGRLKLDRAGSVEVYSNPSI
jgi:trafficking protein particle complex subunit 11